jgi:predicted Zn-dependent peptidase
MFTVETLDTGLRALSAPADGSESVTVLVFVGAGSRYEEEAERGVNHFLEHMFFKGGKKYRNTKEVSVAIDGKGGDFNAFTGKEYAGYYVKIAAEHTEFACDVISDMLLNATFPKEARMYEDTPMYRAGWDFEELLFGDHPLGWDTIGTEKVITTVQQKDFQKHKDLLYTPGNAVVAFAGNIDPTRAVELTQQYFGALSGTRERDFLPLKGFGTKRLWLRTKKTEQAHLVLGVPSISALDPDHFAHKLLAIILGGNMSSRMFLNIREAKGLCYYISTDTDSYLDAGALSTRAGVDQSRLHEAISLIKHEYLECAKHGVTDEEVQRSKDYMKGKFTLMIEDSEERAHFFGKQELLYPKTLDIDSYLAKYDAVTKEQVNSLATRLLTPEELRLVVIGNESDEGALQKLLD